MAADRPGKLLQELEERGEGKGKSIFERASVKEWVWEDLQQQIVRNIHFFLHLDEKRIVHLGRERIVIFENFGLLLKPAGKINLFMVICSSFSASNSFCLHHPLSLIFSQLSLVLPSI